MRAGRKPHDKTTAIPDLDVVPVHELLGFNRRVFIGLCSEFGRVPDSFIIADRIGPVIGLVRVEGSVHGLPRRAQNLVERECISQIRYYNF